jgi:hypothetical protein
MVSEQGQISDASTDEMPGLFEGRPGVQKMRYSLEGQRHAATSKASTEIKT